MESWLLLAAKQRLYNNSGTGATPLPHTAAAVGSKSLFAHTTGVHNGRKRSVLIILQKQPVMNAAIGIPLVNDHTYNGGIADGSYGCNFGR